LLRFSDDVWGGYSVERSEFCGCLIGWLIDRFIDCVLYCLVTVMMSGGGYSTERSESYAADTQQTATLDLKHRRRINNPTSPTPTYDSYSPDLVIL